MDSNRINSISFGGEVFMYGNRSIVAEKKGDNVVIADWAGSDGLSEKNSEKEYSASKFNKLVENFDISNIDCIEVDSDGEYKAIEDEESTGVYEWWFVALDEDDNEMIKICGNNPNSHAFVNLSNILQKYYAEYGAVKDFFDSIID